MAKPETLTLDRLREAVRGGITAIRSRARLQPAGGEGDKVFPPTYAPPREKRDWQTRYAAETRRIDGADVPCILLDSVPSQANRMELALLEAWRAGEAPLPVVQVDFSGEQDLEALEQITSLEAPHRLADALLRDSMLDGKLFRESEVGRAFTEARAADATALYRYAPNALIFGVWDSTGPKGGMGTKIQRAITSEIVAINARPGVKTASRLDPAAQKVDGLDIFKDEHTWDFEKKHLSGAAKKVKASEANLGNIAPNRDDEAGGVTMDYALHTLVLSLPALRRLRFRDTVEGKPLEGEARAKAELSARTALAALALAGAALQREQGYDLRSRCVLIPEAAPTLELVPADGSEPVPVALDAATALALLREAAADAAEHGLRWDPAPITLLPSKKLAEVVRKSRAAAAVAEEA